MPAGYKALKVQQVVQQSGDVRDFYTFDKQLGKGNFGIVHLVFDKKTNEKYACKSISKVSMPAAARRDHPGRHRQPQRGPAPVRGWVFFQNPSCFGGGCLRGRPAPAPCQSIVHAYATDARDYTSSGAQQQRPT